MQGTKNVAVGRILQAKNVLKFVCSRGFAPDPAGELPSWIYGEGNGAEGKEREGESERGDEERKGRGRGKEKERKERKRGKRVGRGQDFPHPLLENPGPVTDSGYEST